MPTEHSKSPCTSFTNPGIACHALCIPPDLQVWSLEGAILHQFKEHTKPVYSVCTHTKASVNFIFSTGRDGRIKVPNLPLPSFSLLPCSPLTGRSGRRASWAPVLGSFFGCHRHGYTTTAGAGLTLPPPAAGAPQ